jgi:hypothetical protein
MRKIFMFLMALVISYTFAVPAFALENIFGGYWRTWVWMQKDFTGEDKSEAKDLQQANTRTRLYYTAKFSDNFKFVTKFEMDANWGDNNSGYGDIGADGKVVEVKNAYADMTFAKTNLKIGVQGGTWNRGFLFDDDFAGAVVTYNASDTLSVPFIWVKAYEGYNNYGGGKSLNDNDVDYYGINPTIKAGNATVKPMFMWLTSDEPGTWFTEEFDPIEMTGVPAHTIENLDLYYLGFDADMPLGPASVWMTALYEFGSFDMITDTGKTGVDVRAYLLALGGSSDVDKLNVHGQLFYASGQNPDDDLASGDDLTQFTGPIGQSYYWSEIMGYGIFDWDVSNGSPADRIRNIMAAQIGVTMKPMDKLSLTGDLWYAQLAEDNANGDKNLGTEIDLIASYSILDNLTLDAVAAYLFAGDATTGGSKNDADPIELGTQLSLSF